MIVYAHTGHWLINVLYAAPLVAVVVLLVRDRLRHRAVREVSDPEPSFGDDGAEARGRATD